LLRDIGMSPDWADALGWCPLALKEFANTDHLDAIAVFFTTLGRGGGIICWSHPRWPWPPIIAIGVLASACREKLSP